MQNWLFLQEAAQPGARAHGFVTGAQEYGVFVSFCNGVRGLAPAQQLGLEPNQDPAKHFPIGKVGPYLMLFLVSGGKNMTIRS